MNKSLLVDKYLLILIFFIFIFGIYFLLNPDVKITQFTNAGSALAVGVDFDSKTPVVVDTDTRQIVAPCNPIENDYKHLASRTGESTKLKEDYNPIPDCEVQIITDSNPALSSALEISKKRIEGKVKKNGKIKNATFIVTVTGVYRGSNCNTTSSGGKQHENCGNHR